jgi:hypothetical protein
LTTTFTPALAATVAALWTDIEDWRFVIPADYPALPRSAFSSGLDLWVTIVPFRHFLRDPRLMAVQKLFSRFLPKRMSGYCHYLVTILSLSSGAIVTARLEFLRLIAALSFWLNPPKGFHAWNA